MNRKTFFVIKSQKIRNKITRVLRNIGKIVIIYALRFSGKFFGQIITNLCAFLRPELNIVLNEDFNSWVFIN